MPTPDKISNRISAAEVLQRYREELLPSFVDINLNDVNQVGLFDERPLHVACVRGVMEEISALVEGGAEINAAGELGNTPLHEAVGQGHKEVIKFLLERGASRSATNELGKTPLDFAKAAGRHDLIKLLT